MPEIVNPAKHVHRLTTVQGQVVCRDCGQVVITPILGFDDERLKGTAAVGLTAEEIAHAILGSPTEVVDALKSACPMRLDLMLIELSERLGYDWPDYIDQLASLTKGENPPHIYDPTLGEVE